MLEAYVELDRSGEELVAAGFDADVVARVVSMVDRAEYKRRQAPPGVKLPPAGVRPRPPDADHESLARLGLAPLASRVRGTTI